MLAQDEKPILPCREEPFNYDDRPAAAVTLRQTDDPDREFPEEVPFLITFPVIPGRPER